MDTLDDFDAVEAGRRLGHDLFCHSRLPADARWPAPVREGFGEARARGLPRAAGDRFVRKWLQLRLGAWQRQRVVADDVTPDLLREIDVDDCPVTRRPLTHATGGPTDGSVDRLNNDGAYSAGNLAVMSAHANRAKGTLSFEQVLAAAEGRSAAGGLSRAEWLRLAVLMQGPAFATRQHLAPLLPLVAPLPCRSVRLAMQQIQRLFTLDCARPATRNALVKALLPACTSDASSMRLRLLGDAVHEGLKQLDGGTPCWDVWLQPRTMQALQRWRDALDAPGWALAARIAGLRAGASRVTPGTLAPWHLASRGHWQPAVRPR